MINCIVAVERSQGIGFKGQMPWPHLQGDMAWFKKMTTDQIVIMGRKTWESIGSKKLPNRINLVISRNPVQGCDISFSQVDLALDKSVEIWPDKEIFIIGGSVIYTHYLDIIDRFYVTEIDADYECDTFFNLNYVHENFTNVTEHATFTDPVSYKIKEYNQ